MDSWEEIYRTEQGWKALLVYNALEKEGIQSVLQQWDTTRGMSVVIPSMVSYGNIGQPWMYVTVSVLHDRLEDAWRIMDGLNMEQEEKNTNLTKAELNKLSRKALLTVLIAIILLFVLPYIVGKLLADYYSH